MGIVLSLLLSLAILGGAGSFVRHVGRNVTPAPVRRQASARVRKGARTARGKLPPNIQKQIDKAVSAQVAANVKQHLAGSIPVIRQAAAQARTTSGKSAPAAKPAASAKPAAAKPRPRPLSAVPPLPARPADIPLSVMRPDHPAPVPVPRKDQPVTTSQVPVTAAGSGADLFSAMRVIVTHGETGGLQAKLRVFSQLGEVFEYEAGVTESFAKRIAEPDQGYTAAVWEPVATAASHVRAAHMAMSDAASALAHLVSLTLGEASATGQRIPHHDQVNAGT